MFYFKTIFCTALAVFMVGLLSAQSPGEIHGKVVDEGGNPIPGVIVSVTDGVTVKGDQTDDEGKFRFKPLIPTYYTFTAHQAGKVTVIQKNILVSPEKITFLSTITLKDSTYEVGPAIVDGYRDPLIDQEGGIVTTIRAKELKNMPSAKGGNVLRIVASLRSDVVPGNRGTDLYFRGSRAGSTQYFIDGVKVYGPVPSIPQSGLSSLQIYTGGVPAKYGDCTGGVVVIETKSYLEDYYAKVNGL